MPELLSVPEAAALLRLHPQTVRLWIGQRRLATVKLGRRRLVERAELQRFIAASRVPAWPTTPHRWETDDRRPLAAARARLQDQAATKRRSPGGLTRSASKPHPG